MTQTRARELLLGTCCKKILMRLPNAPSRRDFGVTSEAEAWVWNAMLDIWGPFVGVGIHSGVGIE